MADLKPCPFCGSDAMFRHIFENPEKCMVGCRGCDAVIDAVFPDEREAAKEWNYQVLADEIAALRAENERLKAERKEMTLRVNDALQYLDAINEQGEIEYSDYSALYDAIVKIDTTAEAPRAALEGGQHGQDQA